MSRFLRRRTPDEEQHASNLELFYDLVFVLAVTQVSHLLLDDLTWRGAARATLVLLVAWWAWNYTTWVTNMLDPDSVVVRLLVLAIMFAGLVMAVAIPDAFGSRALLFAGAYVAIQVGRHAFLTFVVASRDSPERQPAAHILTWLVASGVFWLGGALASGPARIALWLVALALDYVAPLILYYVPGRPRLVVVAGPVVYLLGHVLFRLRMAGSPSWKRLAGAVACVAVGLLGVTASALVVAALLVAVLAGVIAAEYVVNRRREARGDQSPMERLEAGGGG